MFPCLFEALADAAGYKVSTICLTAPGSPDRVNLASRFKELSDYADNSDQAGCLNCARRNDGAGARRGTRDRRSGLTADIHYAAINETLALPRPHEQTSSFLTVQRIIPCRKVRHGCHGGRCQFHRRRQPELPPPCAVVP